MRQEIIANEKAEKDPIVDCSVNVPSKRQRERRQQRAVQIFAQSPQVKPLKGDAVVNWSRSHCSAITRHVTWLTASPTGCRRALEDNFPQDADSRLVSGQSQHYQIRVEAVNHVMQVGLVIGLRSLGAKEFHYFVFSFARNVRVGQEHFDLQVRKTQRRETPFHPGSVDMRCAV